ncbi:MULTISPECIES: hypothetical protein [unclassified Ruegeria]|uniref:hypothetical protein n=1 Tax=unclassified Ruegeria TaxID=2625375 RepID=UPI00148912EF|nr:MULTISPECIES: hypothetical protein [unclassified Ruegeria]
MPLYQLPLIALLAVFTLRNGLKRRLVSSAMLGTLLAYASYLLAIDVTGQIEQVRVFNTLPPEFVTANCAILAAFATAFLTGGAVINAIAQKAPAMPARARGVLVPLFTGLALVTISADGWWLFAPYPQNKGQFQLVPLGGASAMANLLILIAVNRAHSTGHQLGIARAVFWSVIAHYVLAGDRGALLFLLVGAYGFQLSNLPRLTWRHLVKTGVLAAMLMIGLEQISALRSWGAQTPSAQGSFLAEIDLLPQSVAHMYHGIALRLSGYQTFAGSTVELLGTLWLQIIPSGILSAVGVQLYNGPLMLHEFVVHGGGFFVPAELYFAAGPSAVLTIGAYFGALAAVADRLAKRRNDTLMVTLVLLVAASSFYTMFYGVQAAHRMLTLPLVLLATRALFRNVMLQIGPQRAW